MIKKYINVNKYKSFSHNFLTNLFIVLFFLPLLAFSNHSNPGGSDCKLSLVNIIDVTCHSGDDGIIFVQVDTGGGIYHYYLEIFNSSYPLNGGWQPMSQVPAPGQYTNINALNFPNLYSDTFRVILEDTTLQCYDTIGFPQMNIVVSEPSNFSNISNISNASNPITPDGSIFINISGGTNPYSYIWSGPNNFSSNNKDIIGLYSGVYYLNVIDRNGCVFLDTFFIDNLQPCGFGFFNIDDPNCYGFSDGNIEIYSVYGQSPYLYQLSKFDTINSQWSIISSIATIDTFFNFMSISSGTYRYSINDDDGCFVTSVNFNVEDPLPLNSLLSPNFATTSITCDGSIVNFVTGGTSPYQHTWNGPNAYSSNNNSVNNLCIGTYCDSIVDANGCQIEACADVDIFPSCTLDLLVDISSETCRLNDGIIDIQIQNGIAPYQFSLDGGLSYSTYYLNNEIIIDSLISGNYNLIVRDDSLCQTNFGIINLIKSENPSIDSVNLINESCCGFDGSIELFTTPNSSYLIFSIDTFQTFQNNAIFDSLNRGDYLFFIEDTNSCIDSIELKLEADSFPNISMQIGVTDVVCNGDSNGTFKVYFPNDCYDYELYRYTLFLPTQIIDTGHYFNGLISGYYGVIATSNSGTCIDSSVVKYIDEPEKISYNFLEITDVLCKSNDSCSGEVLLSTTPQGGVSPYFYYVKDLYQNTPLGVNYVSQPFTNLCESEYEVQILDANACVLLDTFIISDSSLYLDSFNVHNVSCYNGSNGSVEIFVSGGTGVYDFQWSNLDTLSICDSLSKGNYTVEVYDTNGCILFDTFFVQHPDTLQYNIIGKKDETCMNLSMDGEIYLEFFGGTPPYNYSWLSYGGFSQNTGSGIGDTIFNLTYDTIIIDISDVNLCSSSPTWVTQSVTIIDALNSSNPIKIDSMLTNDSPICNGDNTGFISIDVLSGDGPFQYSIDSMNWVLTDSFTGLFSNLYNVYVKDVYGCINSAEVYINQYDALNVVFDSVKHVSCFDGDDGYISVRVNGGNPPYNYLWTPKVSNLNYNIDLRAEPHIVKIVDSASCVILDTLTLFELSEPIQIQANILSEVSCFLGSDGVLSSSVFGGNPPYHYLWLDNNLDTLSFQEDAIDLKYGMYTLYVTDSFECGPAVDSVFLSQRAEISINLLEKKDNICFNDNHGELIFDVSGGTPKYNLYAVNEENQNFSTNSNYLKNLPSSNYSVWVEDSLLCISDTLFNFNIKEPGKIMVQNKITNLSCFQSNDGKMDVNFFSGTTPYIYSIFSEGILLYSGVSNQMDEVEFLDLYSGQYNVSVADFNSCVIDTLFYVSQPDPIIAEFYSQMDFGREPFQFVAENNSSGGDSYFWDFGNGSLLTTNYFELAESIFKNQGSYNVMMVAHDTILGHQCNDTIIEIINVEGFDVYNVFSPNNDGVNDVFRFNEWMLNGINVEIYNRWGERVYHWNTLNSGWDGITYNGRKAEEGVYYYRLIAKGIDGYHFEENGSITLIR